VLHTIDRYKYLLQEWLKSIKARFLNYITYNKTSCILKTLINGIKDVVIVNNVEEVKGELNPENNMA